MSVGLLQNWMPPWVGSADQRLARAEVWSARATLIILVGIAIEAAVVAGIGTASYISDKRLNLIADVLIGLGLVGEYICIRCTVRASHEVANDLNSRLADALMRATSAEEQLIKLRTVRRAYMTASVKQAMIGDLSPFGGTRFDTGFGQGDGEQADCAWDIEDVLMGAGWQQLNWGVHAVGINVIQRNLRPVAGSVSAQNVEVQIDPAFQAQLEAAAKALVTVLNEIGVEARITPVSTPNTNADAIHVLIGPKR